MTTRVDERCVLPASDALALREAVDGEALERDLRRSAGQQIGEDAAGPGPHGPAERAVAGVEIEVGEAGRADERAAVRGHRAEAGPELHLRTEEHTSELQSIMSNPYGVLCLEKIRQQH